MKDNMVFLSNSIDGKEKDIIGFDTYVEKLNSAIDENAQMIAITSPFGSGKTSIIELLKEKRKNIDNEKILKIPMWSELNHLETGNKSCELHKNFLYQMGGAISSKKGTYINRRLSNNYGLLKLHVNKARYWLFLVVSICCFIFGWVMKEYKDAVIELTSLTEGTIGYLSPALIGIALILLLIIISRTEIIFSSKNSETTRTIEADEIVDLYRNEIITNKSRFVMWIYKILKKIPVIKRLPFLTAKKYIVVIEDLDRTDNGKAVIHFLKELRKYYIYSSKDEETFWNKVIFIVNIKPEATVLQDIKEQGEEIAITGELLYSKLFDYVLELQTINVVDFETVLCGLLKDKQDYLKDHDLTSPTEKISDIPGMQWIIYGTKLDIRKIKNRLNKAFAIYETLRNRFPDKKDGINFQKCAVAAYLTTEYELEFSKTEDKAFEILIELSLKKDLDEETTKQKLLSENSDYVKIVYELVTARHIESDYRLYFYNYPQNSAIYNNDEINIQNAILYGMVCKQFDLVAQRVVKSDSDIIRKTLKKIRQLELPLPQVVIKNESLFLSALKYEYSYVLETFNNIKDTDTTLNKNVTNIIDILKYDGDRKVYTQKIISDFCACWEKVFEESHLVSLREAICAFLGREIQMYKQLFLGEHSAITTKEMALLPFQNALELLNIKSKNFSASHIKYIVNRYKDEAETRELVADKICEILVYACNAFSSKEIVEDILEYMLVSGKVIEELEETVWNLITEEPIDSESEEKESGITFERQNEIFQKYKEAINSVPVTNVPETVLKHINSIDDFDDPYGYTAEISDYLFEQGYHFMSVLVKLNSDTTIDFSNQNIIEGIKENCSWAEKHEKIFLKLRRKILLCADNIFDYQFCFSSAFPLITKEDFLLLTNNKNITILNVLTFFSSDIINDEAVEYISKYFNKEHANNNDAYDVLKMLSQYSADIIKLFFESIDFSHAFLYYNFAAWRKAEIKKIFQEPLELDTYDGKLTFMEFTKYLDAKFEEELVGNTDDDMESRYVKLINRRRGPTPVSSTTISMLKSFNTYYSFASYLGINEKLFEDKEYEYYVVSKTHSSKKFVMEIGERLDKIWPTYIEIFSNPSRLSQTISYMRANEEFLEKIMTSEIYTGFEDNALEQLAPIKQDAKLITHVYSRGTSFANKYFSSMKSGFVDDKAAKAYVELLALDANRMVLKNDDVRNNIYDKLVDPVLKGRYTKLRKMYGYE